MASIITPDGYEAPLLMDDEGRVIIPTPAEIEEMKANGQGEWALRMLEDAARGNGGQR